MSKHVVWVIWCLIFGYATTNSNAFQLCCPAVADADWQNGSHSSGTFDCAEAAQFPIQYDFTNNFGTVGRIEAPLGYGFRKYNKSEYAEQLPKCAPSLYYNISLRSTKPINVAKSACLTIIDNYLIGVTCESSDDESLPSIGIINKCCPHGHVYSAESQKCVQKSTDFDVYASILQGATIFVENAFNCPLSQVLVEYLIPSSALVYAEHQLTWHSKSKILQSDEFCIEALEVSKTKRKLQRKVEQLFLVRACEKLQLCQTLPCIRKCCADGEMYAKGNATTYCKRDEGDIRFHSFASLQIGGNFTKPAEFGILTGLECPKFRLDPDSFSDESHIISARDGSLLVSNTQKVYTNGQYCIEKIRNISYLDQKLYTFLCFDSKVVGNDLIRFKMYPIGLLISCCFYALTLLVYISNAKLRNLPGKILICLVSSLLMAYLGIALGQLMPTSNDDICFISGFFVYFCLMAAFSWMNITCFDIWQTFGSTKSKRLQRSEQTIQFLWYSLYGWGLPTFLTTLTVSLTKSNILPESIRPNFGHGRCWFTYDTIGFASFLFFSGPVGILFLINFVLFLLTLKYCNKVKREIHRMQSSNCEKPVIKSRFFMDKARFAMNTKLCFVMGITWLLELISIMFYDHKRIFFWTISDSFNVLLGVFVFIIFVFKRRFWEEVLIKFGFRSQTERRRNANATCATQSTYAPQSLALAKLNAADGNSAGRTQSNTRTKNENSLICQS